MPRFRCGEKFEDFGRSSKEQLPHQEQDESAAVVLDYCTAIRGVLNDDRGGPLNPPGLRMASALKEVKTSLEKNLAVKKGGGNFSP